MRFFSVFLALLLSNNSISSPIEFTHWWTADGELSALNIIENVLIEHQKKNSSDPYIIRTLAGEGGATEKKILKIRGMNNTLPTFSLLSGTGISLWASLYRLQSLNEIAKADQWEKIMRPLMLSNSKYKDDYLSFPLSIHRTNWLWTNDALFKKANISPPENIDQFVSAIKTFNRLKIPAIAIGNTPWQISLIFENIALAVSNEHFYQSAFVELQEREIKSEEFLVILKKFREISLLINLPSTTSTWQASTMQLLTNQAAMQISGDWVVGEMIKKHKINLSQISCHTFPNTQGSYIYSIDSIVHFKQPNIQKDDFFIKALSSVEVQHDYNKLKGSIPVRNDVNIEDFHPCSIQSSKDYLSAKKHNKLLPSLTDSMAVPPQEQAMVVTLLYDFFNDESISYETFIQNFIAISKIVHYASD